MRLPVRIRSSPWCHDAIMPWYHDTMIPWYHDTTIPWWYDVMMPRYHDIMMVWCHDAMIPWCHDTMMPWCYDVQCVHTNVLCVQYVYMQIKCKLNADCTHNEYVIWCNAQTYSHFVQVGYTKYVIWIPSQLQYDRLIKHQWKMPQINCFNVLQVYTK